MSMPVIRNVLLKNFNLKVAACIIGYGLWYITSQSLTIEQRCTVPIAFYNTDKKSIQGPESINVTLRGKRAALRKVVPHLTLHIDASKITSNAHTLSITKEDLFLPETVSLVHYDPTDSLIHVAC